MKEQEREAKILKEYDDKTALVEELRQKLNGFNITLQERTRIKAKLFQIKGEVFSTKIPESESQKEKWVELRYKINLATLNIIPSMYIKKNNSQGA